MTTVYVDVLFIVNMIIDLMVHTAACLMRRSKIIFWRILCAATAEGMCALGLFLATERVMLYYLLSMVLLFVCVWFTMGYIRLREYVINVGVTVFCFAVFGGVFYLFYQYADVGSIVVFNNNVLYIDVPVFSLLCVAGVCLGVMALASKAFVSILGNGTEYEVRVNVLGQRKLARAKMDTGNDLTDPITGHPVILSNKRFWDNLLPGLDEFIDCGKISQLDENLHSRMRFIHCKTATGIGLLSAFRPDDIQFTYNGKHVRVKNVIIAISKTEISNYDFLLPPHIVKEIEYDTGLDL